jgi:hypothetical protein
MAALDGDKKALADSDLGKMVGAGENPYAQFDGVLKTWGSKIYRVRNFLSGASSLLGKVGTVLTVIGVLISITGIGAPLGAPIATIGRVLGVITLVDDNAVGDGGSIDPPERELSATGGCPRQ